MTAPNSALSLGRLPSLPTLAYAYRHLSSNVHRYFSMRESFDEAQRHRFGPNDPGYPEYTCAQSCLEAGEKLRYDVWTRIEGIAILKVALPFALRAWHLRKRLEMPADILSQFRGFVEHPDGAKWADSLAGSQRKAIERFVSATNGAAVVEQSESERAELGLALRSLVHTVTVGLEREATGIVRWRALRFYRRVLLPAGLVIAALSSLLWTARDINYALNASVQLSSSFLPERYPAPALVDGDKEKLAIHTMNEQSPWATIDLGMVRKLRRVVVHNRRDIRTNSVPLRIETSADGKSFKPFAYREDEFVEWVAEGRTTRARYVRLSVTRASSLQLCEVEVL